MGKSGAMPASAPPPQPGLLADIALPDEAATRRFAEALAPRLGAGDVLLLDGPIGAGKTCFARALIAARLAEAGAPQEDIPSPTFTLVQTYAAGPLEIWHVDLYRLAGAGDVPELGLDEAFGTALCLVEWPDRLGALAPADGLRLGFRTEADGEARRLAVSGGAQWRERLAPLLAAADA